MVTLGTGTRLHDCDWSRFWSWSRSSGNAAIGEPCWTLRVDEESFTRPKLVRVNLKRVHSARAAKPAKESPQKPINPFMNTSFYDVRDFWKP